MDVAIDGGVLQGLRKGPHLHFVCLCVRAQAAKEARRQLREQEKLEKQEAARRERELRTQQLVEQRRRRQEELDRMREVGFFLCLFATTPNDDSVRFVANKRRASFRNAESD